MGAVPRVQDSDGWLSKLWSLFGYPKYSVPYYKKDPKRDPNIDNHPDGPRVGCRDRFVMGDVKRFLMGNV